MTGPHVMMSCGEASGDLYAGALAQALRAAAPGVRISGLGGDRMRAAGATLQGDYRGLSVTGLTEAMAGLPRSWRMLRTLREAARADRPDVFVAVDFPDFNFRLLPAMRALGVPVIYYVSPQVWAWRAGRLETLKRYVDRMLVIFPFEVDVYTRAGVPVECVGHPLVELVTTTTPRETWLGRVGLDPACPVVGVLPGSRRNELDRLLPDLCESARLIRRAVPDAQFVVARAPALDDAAYRPLEQLRSEGVPLAIATEATDDVLAASDVVVTASGTATVQTALHDRPMVIVYRVSPVTYALGQRLVRVPHFGMVNLVAGRAIVPELIQGAFTPARVAAEVLSLLTEPDRVAEMRRDLAEVRRRLGGAGASGRAAAAVLEVAAVPGQGPV